TWFYFFIVFFKIFHYLKPSSSENIFRQFIARNSLFLCRWRPALHTGALFAWTEKLTSLRHFRHFPIFRRPTVRIRRWYIHRPQNRPHQPLNWEVTDW